MPSTGSHQLCVLHVCRLLVTAFLATLVAADLSLAHGWLQEHLVVTLFLTMLVGAGGNAGNQSAIKVIRGLATGSIKPSMQSLQNTLQQQVILLPLLLILLQWLWLWLLHWLRLWLLLMLGLCLLLLLLLLLRDC